MAYRGGSDPPELLARFRAETGHSRVIEAGGDLFMLKLLEFGDFSFLAVDVAGVFKGNLDLAGGIIA